jgi:hypothetical protein
MSTRPGYARFFRQFIAIEIAAASTWALWGWDHVLSLMTAGASYVIAINLVDLFPPRRKKTGPGRPPGVS